MFCVRVAVRVKPGARDRFLAQLKREEVEVPGRFGGCEFFAVFTDPADPDSVLLYEEWTSRRDADAYIESDYFREAGALLFPLMEEAPDSAYYVAERVGP